ncbi:hypothetical protein WN943_020849 [Citrus x changshan-huyou]
MSLVDYASSSDDDVSEAEEQEQKDEQSLNPNDQPQISTYQPSPPPRKSGSSTSNQRPETAAPPSLRPPAFEKLPDACVLLNSASKPVVSGTDHASRVAAAMAENATRKRDSNDVSSTLRRNKLPRGSLPNSKNVLDTAGGLLVPPQLNGSILVLLYDEKDFVADGLIWYARSNVVTEDIGKLFVRIPAEPSSR